MFDTNGTRQVNSFFDRMIAYNSFQSTGLQDLTIKNNQSFFTTADQTSNQVTLANRADSHWNISSFRDWTTNLSSQLFSTNWADIQTDYFIDKVVNPTEIDYTKSYFDTAKLKDQYTQLRLFFNPTSNYKIVTDIASTFNKLSYRG